MPVDPTPLEDIIVSDDGTLTSFVFPGVVKGCKDLVLRIADNFVEQLLPIVSTQEAQYRYSTNHTMADPGTGNCRANNSLITGVTQWAISNTTELGIDRSQFIASLMSGDTFVIQDKDDSTIWVRHTINAAPVNNGSWWIIPVAYVASQGSSPLNNQVLLWQFSQAGGGSVSAGGTGSAVIGDVPTPTPNGAATTFTVFNAFVPASLAVYVNGLRQRPSTDFIVLNDTQFQLTSTPLTGDSLLTDYYRQASPT